MPPEGDGCELAGLPVTGSVWSCGFCAGGFVSGEAGAVAGSLGCGTFSGLLAGGVVVSDGAGAGSAGVVPFTGAGAGCVGGIAVLASAGVI